MGIVAGKSIRDNTGEQLVLSRKVVVDHRLGNAGLFGYLKGGGAVEPLIGEQQGGRLDDVLFSIESGGGHGQTFEIKVNNYMNVKDFSLDD